MQSTDSQALTKKSTQCKILQLSVTATAQTFRHISTHGYSTVNIPIEFFDDDDSTHVATDEIVIRDDHVSDAALNQFPRQVLAIH